MHHISAISHIEKRIIWMLLVLATVLSIGLLVFVSQMAFLVGVAFITLVMIFSLYPILGLYLGAATFAFIEGNFYITGVLSVPYADAFFLLSFIGFVISHLWQSAFYGKTIQKREFILFIPFLFFFLAYTISLFNAEYVLGAIKFVLRPIAFLYLAYVFTTFNLINSKKEFLNVLWYMVFGGVILSSIAIASLFQIDEATFSRIRPVGLFDWWPLGQNQNVLAQGLIVIIPATIVLAMHQANVILKKGLILFSGLMIFLALGTFSRAAWIALFLQGLILMCWECKHKVVTVLKHSWLVILVTIPFLFLMMQLLTSDISQSANKNRLLLTDIAIESFKESPIIGQGAGSFVSLVSQDRWYTLWFGHGIDSHGVIQKIMAEAGTLGLITFLYLVYRIFKYIYTGYIKAGDKTIMLGMIAMVVSMSVFQLFNTSYFTAVLWLPIGLALAASKIEQKV